ncbi:hypothetical protein [Estrella lausannensis]|uniref:Ubiquitin-like protease family profile domain-containing protein n=1 Tax=Estrella lausannensis TaxID=483423 RepID=A0A0H5DRZ0_9BACT|nr:hypothetical protein [Estrella lausannensis]CRX39417.1 hypothetical protein ELAC_2096 [Estrella lausannensis]
MQYEPSMNFRDNMNALVNFPKNNEHATIKSDSSGKLFSSDGSYLARTVGWYSGSDLKGTTAVINRTCQDMLNEIGETVFKAEHSDSLVEAANAREFYLKAGQALESMKEIQKVYAKRYEGKQHEGMNELSQTIQAFEEGLKRFEEQESNLAQRILSASSFLFLEAENDLGKSFIYVPNEVEPSQAFAGLEQDLPKVSSWWGTYGQGPTVLGKLASGFNTAKEIAVGTFSPYAYEASSDRVALGGQQRVANGGKQLGGSDVYHYIEGISKKTPVNAIHDFHLAGGSAVNNKTVEQVKSIINSQSDYFTDPSLPVVIPVVFTGEGVWERNHIAVILIKDNCVEYYDAKGIVSENKPLAKGSGTLRDVLEFCRDKFTKGGFIRENPYPHQYDAHNCGVFVCRHLHDRLIKNSAMGTMKTEAPSLSEVEDFRQEVIKTAYPADEKGNDKGNTVGGSFSEDDF